jgi:hypothetical protein
MQQFIASHAKAPKELVLDVDATHVPLHGEQERGHFHACYDNYCQLPPYVFVGQACWPACCVLRASDPASVVVSAVIKRLLVPLRRRAWPKTKIVVRADPGLRRPLVAQRLECWGVSYIIGLQNDSRLQQEVELAELALADQFMDRPTKQRMFGEFEYAAKTWDKPRRVIARLEHGPQGANPRFVVTDLKGSPKVLYERRYCARGEAENRIKEAQLDLLGRRASCHRFRANQPRLLPAALAYTLMINLRRLALKGTELAQACTATIRTRPLKIGAAILRNGRRVRVLMASAHPMKHVFITAARALSP